MKFALIYSYDRSTASPTEGEVSDRITFASAVEVAGAHVYEAGLQPPARARTISKRDAQLVTVDGPMIGCAGEVIAGFWVADVDDAAAAADWAQQMPTATYGKVEIRPIVEFES